MQVDTVQADATLVEEPATSSRPWPSLGHLIRISLYWLGLTAIDGAVGLLLRTV